MLILAFIVVVVISSTIILSKKRDIAIMRALGSLPRKLYSFYLTEIYVIFIIAFFIGVFIGIFSFSIFTSLLNLTNLTVLFQWDFIYTPILFFSCMAGIFVVPGYILRRIGNQKIVRSFSKDIPYDYSASKGIKFIPKWISSIGLNFKISVINTIRKKGEFKRYLVVFSIISIILFTLGLGTIVLYTSSYNWVKKSQPENLIVIGHQDVIHNYSLMYEMFQNPDILVENGSINFLQQHYLFNTTALDNLTTISEIRSQEFRLINFFQAEEIPGVHLYEDGRYLCIGQDREGVFPVIGVNHSDILQNFEIEGEFITQQGVSDYYAVIGDGLAYNFFDFPLDQAIFFDEMNDVFEISGVIIDSLYSGYASYINIDKFREKMNLTSNQVNLAFIELNSEANDNVREQLGTIIDNSLGQEFSYLQMDPIFTENLNFISNLSLIPSILIVIMSAVAIVSLYNYQKGGIMDKVKDFLIMRAIGSKAKSIRKILFLEALYVIIPSLGLSLGIGMILNSIVLFERVNLPDIIIPFSLIGLLFSIFGLFNFLSLFPVMKKLKLFTVKDFEMY
ncbi:MAG: ABC transporter permease [Promethearchaeota archaeon]|nr:MAG: ABC transporter permease [Candidatus Lokiarchaeota archaeon]